MSSRRPGVAERAGLERNHNRKKVPPAVLNEKFTQIGAEANAGSRAEQKKAIKSRSKSRGASLYKKCPEIPPKSGRLYVAGGTKYPSAICEMAKTKPQNTPRLGRGPPQGAWPRHHGYVKSSARPLFSEKGLAGIKNWGGTPGVVGAGVVGRPRGCLMTNDVNRSRNPPLRYCLYEASWDYFEYLLGTRECL